jgi:hypothetical protein
MNRFDLRKAAYSLFFLGASILGLSTSSNAQTFPAPPVVYNPTGADATIGSWFSTGGKGGQGALGQCGYVLAGYQGLYRQELPIVSSGASAPTPGTTYSGGALPAQADCANLNVTSDPNGPKFSYFPYADLSPGQGGRAMGFVWNCADTTGKALARPLNNACTTSFPISNPPQAGYACPVSALPPATTWDDAGELGGRPNLYLDVDLSTVPAGTYRFSVYAVDYDLGGGGCKDSGGNQVTRNQVYEMLPFQAANPTNAAAAVAIGGTAATAGPYVNGAWVTWQVVTPAKFTVRARLNYSCANGWGTNTLISGVFLDPQTVGAACPNPPQQIPPGGPYTTYTQGGWGAPPHGNNPGMLLKNNFATVYPGGFVAIGGTNKLTFTSALSIENFLPQGGTAGALAASATNPTSSAAGVFAGQVLALQLSVDFSNKGIKNGGLALLHVASGPLAGKTVAQVLAYANAALGGDGLPAGISSISQLNDIVDKINNNFDNGTVNLGYLIP